MILLDGKKTSNDIKGEIALEVREIVNNGGKKPHLAAILVGNNGASETYVNAKVKACEKVGFESTLVRLPDNVSEEVLLSEVDKINNNQDIDGLIVQLPLPSHIDEMKVTEAIDPKKDVDGFHPVNLGNLTAGSPIFIPCTPKGILRFFEHYKIELSGKHVVVVGRSNIVGRPISILTSLKGRYLNATTTICHSGSSDLFKFTQMADVIILALGKPHFLKSEHIKQGAIVIDVGINRIENKEGRGILVGDADIKSLEGKASAITPVPGGVGPMTIAMLVENTVEAAERLLNNES